jgi:hypothetical protein
MTMRALIVLLAVLNLGVTAWWLSRPDAAPVAASEEAPSGIARLQLVSERPDLRPPPGAGEPQGVAAVDNNTADRSATDGSAVESSARATPPAERCYSLGPFDDPAAMAAAQSALRPLALRLRARTAQRDSGRGWRVFLPAAADRAGAEAAAARLRAAGFTDLLIVADGAEANSVALGRFSTETRARQHAQTLVSAGFEARAEPLGEARSTGWIDLAAAADFDAAAARRASRAAEARGIDCASIR